METRAATTKGLIFRTRVNPLIWVNGRSVSDLRYSLIVSNTSSNGIGNCSSWSAVSTSTTSEFHLSKAQRVWMY